MRLEPPPLVLPPDGADVRSGGLLGRAGPAAGGNHSAFLSFRELGFRTVALCVLQLEVTSSGTFAGHRLGGQKFQVGTKLFFRVEQIRALSLMLTPDAPDLPVWGAKLRRWKCSRTNGKSDGKPIGWLEASLERPVVRTAAFWRCTSHGLWDLVVQKCVAQFHQFWIATLLLLWGWRDESLIHVPLEPLL
jgi:hypothetical protein